MSSDYEVFEEALTLFHRYSLQNDETVRQMQEKGILPAEYRRDFDVLDIGAGQGYLPSLMQAYVDTLVLVEPNPRCVEVLNRQFAYVYPNPWGELVHRRLQAGFPEGFDLITMSHMLYHFQGLDDIREKIRMALSLLKPNGHLVIILNQPSAPMARVGTGYQLAEGREDEFGTNRDLHASCHDARFYREAFEGQADVAIYPIDTPLKNVESREELVSLFRMCLLNPLSNASCVLEKLDTFIEGYLDSQYPDLTYPATIPSRDDLVIIRKTEARTLAATR